MDEVITSMHNPLLKLARSLVHRKYREEHHLFVVEGFKLVEAAVVAGEDVYCLLIGDRIAQQPLVQQVRREVATRGGKTVIVKQDVLARVADTEQPQGIMAILRMRGAAIETVLAAPYPLLVVLDGLQDPGNVGTIIRTADAAGAGGIIALPGTADIYNPKAVRATMGSLFHLPVIRGMERSALVRLCRFRGIQLIGADVHTQKLYYEVNYSLPTAICLGSESAGLSPELAACVTDRVKIPMIGKAESLNVATAAAVILYEAVRQRAGGATL